MQGKELDLDKLRMRNELTLAVGNARVNSRGDEIGPGGKIVKKREDFMSEYHAHPDSVPSKQEEQVVAQQEKMIDVDDDGDFEPEEK